MSYAVITVNGENGQGSESHSGKLLNWIGWFEGQDPYHGNKLKLACLPW